MAAGTRVVISIDVKDSPNGGLSAARETMTRELADQLRSFQLPVSWGFADPGHSLLAKLVDRRQQPQEMTVLADEALVQADRTQFVKRLKERVDAARRLGMAVHTLAAPVLAIQGRLDVLVHNRIAMFRPHDAASAALRQQCARFGVWTAPAELALPGEHAWWAGGALGAVRRSLRESTALGRVTHLQIDVAALAAARRGARSVLTVLADLAAARRRQQVEVLTPGQLARTHRVLRTGPGRSILRAA